MENHHFYEVNHLQMAQFLASYFDIEGRFRCPIMFTTSSFGLIPGFTGESVSVLLRPCLPSPWKCRPSFLSSLPSLPSSFPSCLPSCLPSCFSCSLFWFPFWLLCLPCLGDLLQTFLRFLLLCLTLFPKTLSVSNHCWGLRWCNSMKRISTRNLQIFAMGVPSGIFFFNRFFFRVLDLEIVWGLSQTWELQTSMVCRQLLDDEKAGRTTPRTTNQDLHHRPLHACPTFLRCSMS